MSENTLLVVGKKPYNSGRIVQVEAPPSKSISHRTLVAACLANGQSRIQGVLESEDTKVTSEILISLGAKIWSEGDDVVVQGLGGNIEHENDEPLPCYVHDSGTTCRFLAAVLAAGKGKFYVHGSPRMSQRPMLALTQVLSKLGAEIVFEKELGYLPFTIITNGLDNKAETQIDGKEILIDTSQTSQYLSGLLLAAPLGRGLKIIPTAEAADELVSWSYVQLTLQTLQSFGIDFQVESRTDLDAIWNPVAWSDLAYPKSGLWRISVASGIYQPKNIRIEGDYSNASYFLAAGAVGKTPVFINNLSPMSMQGDMAMLDILHRMGANLSIHSKGIEVTPQSTPLQGIKVNMADCPDLVPTVATVAAFVQGPTIITGVAHLRIKECDRITAPATELAKVGCEVKELDDGMIITPPKSLRQPTQPFDTYNDHRMAMSMALLSCSGFDVSIKNPNCTSKSFPNFWKEWMKI